jgi:hypothetical protein
LRISGRGQGQGKTRRNRVMEYFLSSLLDKNIEGVRNNIWLEVNPNVKGEADASNVEQLWVPNLPGDINKT